MIDDNKTNKKHIGLLIMNCIAIVPLLWIVFVELMKFIYLLGLGDVGFIYFVEILGYSYRITNICFLVLYIFCLVLVILKIKHILVNNKLKVHDKKESIMNEEEYGQKYQDALDKIESSDFESNSNTVYQTDTQQQDVVSQQSVEKYSKFDGNGIVYFFICVGCLMIQAVTLFLTRPWTVCLLQKYLATHTTIDGKQLYFDGTAAQLFGTWIKWILLTFITFGFYYFFSPFRMKKWVTKHTHAKVA